MKKRIIGSCILVIGILFSGSIVYNETTESLRNITREEQLEMFDEVRSQLESEVNYIEHITEIKPNGYITDTYVDKSNYLEQMDQYNNNELVNRMIFYEKGSKVLSIRKDESEFEGQMTTLDQSIANENKKNFEEYSQFKTEIENALKQGESTFFREEMTSDSSVIKYISKNLNLYFDKESKFLVKKEEIVGKEITKTIEFERIERTSSLGNSLFKQESPIKYDEDVNLSNIRIENIIQKLEAPLENARG